MLSSANPPGKTQSPLSTIMTIRMPSSTTAPVLSRMAPKQVFRRTEPYVVDAERTVNDAVTETPALVAVKV